MSRVLLTWERIENPHQERQTGVSRGTDQGCRAHAPDFDQATVERCGIHNTVQKTAGFNDKKLDVMVDVFARSILAGKNLGFPEARDSVIASEVSWAMLNDAICHVPPVRGTQEEMQPILEHRRNLVNGFGLPIRTHDVGESLAVC